MKRFIVMICLINGAICAMNCPLTPAEVIIKRAFEKRMSCILGVSCECPTYLGKCRYFHTHINLLLEIDRRELQMQARLDELNERRLAEAQRLANH